MKMRRIIFFVAPSVLLVLTLLAVVFWILEVKAHTAFTDAACPLFAGLLFFAFPVLVLTTWWSGRTLDKTLQQKLLVWTPFVVAAVPWVFVCMAFLMLMSWKGD